MACVNSLSGSGKYQHVGVSCKRPYLCTVIIFPLPLILTYNNITERRIATVNSEIRTPVHISILECLVGKVIRNFDLVGNFCFFAIISR